MIYGVVSVAAVLIIAGGTALAATSGAKSSKPRASASKSIIVTLDSMSGTTLTVTAKGPDAAITTVDASNAKILLDGVASTVSKLTAGDKLIVSGAMNGTTSITAARISDGTSTVAADGPLSGVVTAVGTNSITMTVTEHTRTPGHAPTSTTSSVTVATNKKTRFSVPGVKKASIADVVVGSRATVIGVSPTGTGTARSVSVIPAPKKTSSTSTSTPSAS